MSLCCFTLRLLRNKEKEMPEKIDRSRLQGLMEAGAQVVDVLPEDEYEEQHIPGSINIPLKQLTSKAAGQLRRDRPVVLYCYDYQ